MVDIPIDTVELSSQQQLVRNGIRDLCNEFDDEY